MWGKKELKSDKFSFWFFHGSAKTDELFNLPLAWQGNNAAGKKFQWVEPAAVWGVATKLREVITGQTDADIEHNCVFSYIIRVRFVKSGSGTCILGGQQSENDVGMRWLRVSASVIHRSFVQGLTLQKQSSRNIWE